ncbi:MAG: S1-like domain-containing RNA-binding protein, partial [Flavobacteriaceae bacterium]
MNLGQYNSLSILRETDPGLFLGDEQGNEVLLPHKYKPEQYEIGQRLEVFVYLDNQQRPIATTQEPYVTLNHFAY